MRKATGNPNWAKGVSGNPGGRPKLPRDLVANAKAHSLEMLEVLISLARDANTPPTARISAATAVLDRGYGKPTVSIETSHREVARMTDAKLEAIIRGEAFAGEGGVGDDAGRGDGEPVH